MKLDKTAEWYTHPAVFVKYSLKLISFLSLLQARSRAVSFQDLPWLP